MTEALQVVFAGLTIGCTYSLVGLGFSLIFSASSIFNFAQGEWLMLGAMLFFTFTGSGIAPWPALILGALGMAGVGLVVWLLLVEPIRRSGGEVFTIVIATLAFSTVAQAGAELIWGSGAFRIAPLAAGEVSLGSVTVSAQSLIVIGATVAVYLGFAALLRFTFTGKAFLAAASSRRAALLVGIDVERMVALAFVLSAVVMAVAGATVGALTFATATMGAGLGIGGFAAAVIGGIRAPFGAVVGGLAIGLLEAIWAARVGADYATAVVYVVLVLTLLVRPEGILGKGVAPA